MMDRKYNPQTLDDLAALVASTRRGIDPPWQIPGIKAALVQAANRDGTVLSLAQLAYAALIVASDRSAKTPARLMHEGPWWDVSKLGTSDSSSAHISYPSPEDCAICGQPEAIHAHVATYGDHKYLPRELHRPRGPEPTKETT